MKKFLLFFASLIALASIADLCDRYGLTATPKELGSYIEQEGKRVYVLKHGPAMEADQGFSVRFVMDESGIEYAIPASELKE
jgi:hypothetical protein